MRNKKRCRQLLALSTGLILLLSACTSGDGQPSSTGSNRNDALVWSTWHEYEGFLELVAQECPEIELDFHSYTGFNRTGYSWAQMRADDIPDIFITSQRLDDELSKERLVDLSEYSFTDGFATSLLDQVSIDGGIYLLPVSNAMYGIYYNKTLMEEHGWELPTNLAELETLCAEIREAGLIPGVIGTELTGNTFSAVFNLAKTDWLTTPEGLNWERNFLAGEATAAGMWEDTMDYVQKYVDLGMFTTDPEDRHNRILISDYLGGRKAVFCTAAYLVSSAELPDSTDELGLMPFVGEDGSKNIYMYSPTSYIGISRRLTEPGNEKKLENAIQLLSLLYSPEGQETFLSEESPCVMSVLNRVGISEDALIQDAQQAMAEGRAFPMTYAKWENILSDVGQAYKEWFRGENSMDGPRCIARMDELQTDYLNHAERLNFCESTADFTLEETAALIGKALGSAVGADAVLVPLGEFHDGVELDAGITGKLYTGRINAEITNTILPSCDGEYAMMTMTGAQAKALADAGFDAAGDGNPFPYVLVTKGGEALEEETVYQVAFLMNGYTEETGRNYDAQVEKGSLRIFLRDWLTGQKSVSPDGNLWQ